MTTQATRATPATPPRLLTPGEVAKMFRVDPKTVTRWAKEGRLGSLRTPGNSRRYPENEVYAFFAALNGTPAEPPPVEHITGRDQPRYTGPPVVHDVQLNPGAYLEDDHPLICSCGYQPEVSPHKTVRDVIRLGQMHAGEGS